MQRPPIDDPQLAAYVDTLEREAAQLVDAVASAFGGFRLVAVTAASEGPEELRESAERWAQEMSAALKAAPALVERTRTARPDDQRVRD